MPAYIYRPCVVLPSEKITTEEILAHLRVVHAGVPNLERFLTAAQQTTVETRHLTRPLRVKDRTEMTTPERRVAAYQDALALAIQAGRQALDDAGLQPKDIGGLITVHSTPGAMPHFEAELLETLQLQRTVRRQPVIGSGSAGGTRAISLAEQQITAHPETHVLIVSADCLSTHGADLETDLSQSIIDRVLYGDGAAAAVVSSHPLVRPCSRIENSLDYALPDSLDWAADAADAAALFDSTPAASRAVKACMPTLRTWLGDQGDLLDFAVVHPASPGVLHNTATGLGLAADPGTSMLRHSWTSLRTLGNMGAPGVLDVLARIHDDPPTANASGFLLAYGPGVIMAVGACHWAV